MITQKNDKSHFLRLWTCRRHVSFTEVRFGFYGEGKRCFTDKSPECFAESLQF